MSKRKKKLPPRAKRMNRTGRLQSARATKWVESYTGGHLVRGYRRKFGVDLLCAITELRALGQSIPASYEAKVRATLEAVSQKRRDTKLAAEQAQADAKAEAQFEPWEFWWGGNGKPWDEEKEAAADNGDLEIPF
jgi:hypothetical protein